MSTVRLDRETLERPSETLDRVAGELTEDERSQLRALVAVGSWELACQVGVEHASGEPVDILGVGLAEAPHPLTGPAHEVQAFDGSAGGLRGALLDDGARRQPLVERDARDHGRRHAGRRETGGGFSDAMRPLIVTSNIGMSHTAPSSTGAGSPALRPCSPATRSASAGPRSEARVVLATVWRPGRRRPCPGGRSPAASGTGPSPRAALGSARTRGC